MAGTKWLKAPRSWDQYETLKYPSGRGGEDEELEGKSGIATLSDCFVNERKLPPRGWALRSGTQAKIKRQRHDEVKDIGPLDLLFPWWNRVVRS